MGVYEWNNAVSNIKAYYGLTFEQFDMPVHAHYDTCEIMYVVKGKCTIFMSNETLHLNENQFIFIDKKVNHRLVVEEGDNGTILNLEFTLDKEGVDVQQLAREVKTVQTFLNARIPYIVLPDTGNMGSALKDLIMELENKRLENTCLINLLFMRMIIELSLCAENTMSLSGIVYVRKAKKFISENLERNLQVPLIAKAVGVNDAYLQKLFKKHLGCGIMTYTNRLRLDQAEFLLKNTCISVTDIAFKVGFNNRQNFGLAFTKANAMSPHQFRKLTGKQLEVETGTFKRMAEPKYISHADSEGDRGASGKRV